MQDKTNEIIQTMDELCQLMVEQQKVYENALKSPIPQYNRISDYIDWESKRSGKDIKVTAEEILFLARVMNSGVLKTSDYELGLRLDAYDKSEDGIGVNWAGTLSKRLSSVDELAEELAKYEGVGIPHHRWTEGACRGYGLDYKRENINVHLFLTNSY